MNSFKLKIVTFDKIIFEDDVIHCAIYTPSGKLGIKARHETFATVLEENSSIEYELPDNTKRNFDITNGLFLFKDNSCTIMVVITEKN